MGESMRKTVVGFVDGRAVLPAQESPAFRFEPIPTFRFEDPKQQPLVMVSGNAALVVRVVAERCSGCQVMAMLVIHRYAAELCISCDAAAELRRAEGFESATLTRCSSCAAGIFDVVTGERVGRHLFDCPERSALVENQAQCGGAA